MHTIKLILLRPNYYNNWEDFTIKAWVDSNRGNNKLRFININDGSTVKNLQVVLKGKEFDFNLLDQIKNGAAIKVIGTLKATPDAPQPIELVATSIELLSNTENDYPIQNQEINIETLREIPHVRHRTKTLRSAMLIRSTLAQEIHKYFMANDFYLMSSPIITSNDGEGAGEAFNVSDNSPEPFFGQNKKATLGVTGQLHAESYAIGFKKVYTFAPTFRAEHSNTKKHAAEFWMVEPEVAFYELNDVVKLADHMLKTVIKATLAKCKFEFDYLEDHIDKNLRNRLALFTGSKLNVIDYADAIKELAKVKSRFENQDIKFGLDLATEHERYLAEELFNGPVAVINFPKSFKAFYMHQNEDGKTVAAFDLLVPGIGELIGGSQREVRYDKLLERIKEIGIDQEEIQWYLDLRKFGDSGSSGFGLGFERLVMYITGLDNIRDVIPYPRTTGNIRM
ncbi:asparagine--tRNA ligase [Mycoplasma crocodyli]|uniref:Asparagine--tRNA ligase n=1 Tax=Mycoplasma crocodyli (strain ATCC 51981 / MP145) TaxID=512564 RepID=D5E544_MYCCM|nr:asparagine--tRNA ligase [Mycoplasma crocodyli]ADE19951.1 asparagine--tRNA ligase [Mycoplasma crocodyli MP145]